ncbi:MAG: methionyl-tRNA formyltransferase [Patescibacteria group bacterium]|nr:methionyl-tRNA formyltransferase [Patescibacteria group bacterium]
MIKIGYFGSADFSADFLEMVITDKKIKSLVSINFVVTQPDKPAGRKQILTSTPVKRVALMYQLSIRYEPTREELRNLDLGLIYSYSKIIPKDQLQLPRLGFWCLHPSLLPQYRGPAPIVWSLINGDQKTGITIFKIDEKIDHGPIIDQKSLTIRDNYSRIDLEKEINHLGVILFKKLIKKISCSPNQIYLKPQNHQSASYTRRLKKEDGFISYQTLRKILSQEMIFAEEMPNLIKEVVFRRKEFQSQTKLTNRESASLIYNLFRGLTPWPGLWTILPDSRRLKIVDLSKHKDRLYLQKVQLEGKRPVEFSVFKRAYSYF